MEKLESKSVLEIKNLKKYYGNIHAVDGISFEVEKGEIFALLGPNGAGKTTTIKCILGLRKKDEGSIDLQGSIAYLPEGKELYGSYTVKKMIEVTADVTDEFDKEKCWAYIDKFQIPLDEKVSNLSNGQTTQLYLALVLSQRAELYIFDEPTWGLDPIVRNQVLDMIREIPLLGASVLYTSHILGEVEKVADKVAIMNRGKILEVGYLDDIKERYCAISVPSSTKFQGISGYRYKSTESENIYIVNKEYALTNNFECSPVTFETIFEALVINDSNLSKEQRSQNK